MSVPKVSVLERVDCIGCRIKELNSVLGGGGWVGGIGHFIYQSVETGQRFGVRQRTTIERAGSFGTGWFFSSCRRSKNTHHAKVLISCKGLTVTPYTVVVKYEKSCAENIMFYHLALSIFNGAPLRSELQFLKQVYHN